MSNIISELPPFIQKIVKKRATVYSDKLSSSFLWETTIENVIIWKNVMDGNYQPFYEFHVNLNNKNNDKFKFR